MIHGNQLVRFVDYNEGTTSQTAPARTHTIFPSPSPSPSLLPLPCPNNTSITLSLRAAFPNRSQALGSLRHPEHPAHIAHTAVLRTEHLRALLVTHKRECGFGRGGLLEVDVLHERDEDGDGVSAADGVLGASAGCRVEGPDWARLGPDGRWLVPVAPSSSSISFLNRNIPFLRRRPFHNLPMPPPISRDMSPLLMCPIFPCPLFLPPLVARSSSCPAPTPSLLILTTTPPSTPASHSPSSHPNTPPTSPTPPPPPAS